MPNHQITRDDAQLPATSEGVQPDLVFVSNERRGIIADLTLKGPSRRD